MKTVAQGKTASQWSAHMAKRHSSGMSRAEYCRTHALNLPQMTYWERRLGKGLQEVTDGWPTSPLTESFVKAIVQSSSHKVKSLSSTSSNASAIRLTLGDGLFLDLASETEPSWLAGLIKAVRGTSHA